MRFRLRPKSHSHVGLDIGAQWIKIAVISMLGERLEITNLTKVPTPKDGEIADVMLESTAEAIRNAYNEAGIFSPEVYLNIGGAFVISRSFTFPSVGRESLGNVLASEFKAFLPANVEPEDVIIDYQILKEQEQEGGEVAQVLIAAARKEAVADTMALVQAAGLIPRAIDASSLALYNSFVSHEWILEMKTVAIVDVGAERTNTIIVQDGVVSFASEFPLAGNHFTHALAEHLDLDLQHAEALKQRAAGSPTATSVPLDGVDYPLDRIVKGLYPAVEQFASELRRMFSFYQSRCEGRKSVEKLLITGGGAQTLGLIPYLEDYLEIEIAVGDPLIGKDVCAEASSAIGSGSGAYALAIGLALKGAYSGLNTINLVPSELVEAYQAQRSLRGVRRWALSLVGTLVFILLIMLGLWFTVASRTRHLHHEVGLRAPQQEEMKRLKVSNRELQSMVSVAEGLRERRVAWPEVLYELSRILPEEIWLTGLVSEERVGSKRGRSEEGEKTPETAGSTISLNGASFSEERVSEFLSNLEDSFMFRRVRLVELRRTEVKESTPGVQPATIEFQIKIQLAT
jgi:type IV pilus assembly protein PilM